MLLLVDFIQINPDGTKTRVWTEVYGTLNHNIGSKQENLETSVEWWYLCQILYNGLTELRSQCDIM